MKNVFFRFGFILSIFIFIPVSSFAMPTDEQINKISTNMLSHQQDLLVIAKSVIGTSDYEVVQGIFCTSQLLHAELIHLEDLLLLLSA